MFSNPLICESSFPDTREEIDENDSGPEIPLLGRRQQVFLVSVPTKVRLAVMARKLAKCPCSGDWRKGTEKFARDRSRCWQ